VRYLTVPPENQNGPIWEAGNDTEGKSEADLEPIAKAIKDNLETDAVRKEIYTRMKAAPIEYYTFRSLKHAQRTVNQRLETFAMMYVFNRIKNYRYNDLTHPPSTTATQWDTGTRFKFLFRQKSGTALDAINQLCQIGEGQNLTYGECIGAAFACIWHGAAVWMPEGKFNELYSGTTALNMDYVTPPGNGSWSKNVSGPAPGNDTSEFLVPGDEMYFQNHNYLEITSQTSVFAREFREKGWLGADRIYRFAGENAFYFGNGQFEGLGITSRTEGEMRQELMNAYNNNLATVIQEVNKIDSTGTYVSKLTGERLKNIRTITDADDPNIKIIHILRIKQ
jgi:hypothetical protein